MDPGVGNDQEGQHPQPRSLVLRRDGVLFIGPDNGNLTFVCPKGSIVGIWEINPERLNQLSGIDVSAGGTFHGRDLFCEAAFRIAAGTVSLDEIGIPYSTLDIKTALVDAFDEKNASKNRLQSIAFESVRTERFIWFQNNLDENELFDLSFLLGMIQSPLYGENSEGALTRAKKLFIITPAFNTAETGLIAIVNEKTGNIFIGANNGLGTSFFKEYPKEDVSCFLIANQVLETIKNEKNNEIAYTIIKQQEPFQGELKEIPFFGNESVLIRDPMGRPEKLQARIWIDLYGNIKTTLQSQLLNEAKKNHANVKIILNGIEKSAIFAETFSQVPAEQLFVYNGSTAAIGLNPHRSKRYVELTANGIFGKFGIDFFEKEGRKPKSGELIWFHFEYNPKSSKPNIVKKD